MFRYLFKPYRIKRLSREGYVHTDDQGRRAGLVVYWQPGGSPKYWIDDTALTHWLIPEGQRLTPNEKSDLVSKMKVHLGSSVGLESARGAT
jgi:hypothetical protein